LFDTRGEEIVSAPGLLEDYGIGLAQHDKTTLRLTGFFEMVGFHKDFSEKRKNWLLERFKKHVTKSDQVRIVQSGVGYRPCTPDQIPVIGRIPGYSNAYVASGHCRLGVTLAPATGNIIKAMIAEHSSRISSSSSWYDPGRFVK
jgi:D-amino-acid dehydrogenase